eukprot:5716805-Prymnesium_polylepis.1
MRVRGLASCRPILRHPPDGWATPDDFARPPLTTSPPASRSAAWGTGSCPLGRATTGWSASCWNA